MTKEQIQIIADMAPYSIAEASYEEDDYGCRQFGPPKVITCDGFAILALSPDICEWDYALIALLNSTKED